MRPDKEALSRIAEVEPVWAGLVPAREIMGEGRLLLHAGPPFVAPDEIPTPVLNSLSALCVLEGWAPDPDAGAALVRSGEIRTAAAQDHGILIPLAGAVSPSTMLLEVQDAREPSRRRLSPINEGMALCTRLGIRHPGLVDHLRWLNGPFAEWLAGVLAPMPLWPVLSEALAAGDDAHARTVAGSVLVRERLPLAEAPSEVAEFLAGAPAFALNLWMAACALALSAAEGVEGASLVTRAGGNGVRFGLRLAGGTSGWVTVPAPAIRGVVEERHAGRQALPAIGDSAVVDLFGLGGQALSGAPELRRSLEPVLPPDAAERPALLEGPLAALGGRPVATSARKAAARGRGPLVLLGMIDAAGEAGRIGGGVVDLPAAILADALAVRV